MDNLKNLHEAGGKQPKILHKIINRNIVVLNTASKEYLSIFLNTKCLKLVRVKEKRFSTTYKNALGFT